MYNYESACILKTTVADVRVDIRMIREAVGFLTNIKDIEVI